MKTDYTTKDMSPELIDNKETKKGKKKWYFREEDVTIEASTLREANTLLQAKQSKKTTK